MSNVVVCDATTAVAVDFLIVRAYSARQQRERERASFDFLTSTPPIFLSYINSFFFEE